MQRDTFRRFMIVSFLGGCVGSAVGAVNIQVQNLNGPYYTPLINGPVYRVVSVENTGEKNPANITDINLTGSFFRIVNRLSNQPDPAYGNYPQCAITTNSALDQVAILMPNETCIVVLQGKMGSPSDDPQAGSLAIKTHAGSNAYNQSFQLINTSYAYVVGGFTSIGGFKPAQKGFIAACTEGECQNALAQNQVAQSGEIEALTRDAAGNLYVGGSFQHMGNAGATTGYLIAKCTPGGNCENALQEKSSANNVIEALAVDQTGQIYAGGQFHALGGAAAQGYLLAKCMPGGACINALVNDGAANGAIRQIVLGNRVEVNPSVRK